MSKDCPRVLVQLIMIGITSVRAQSKYLDRDGKPPKLRSSAVKKHTQLNAMFLLAFLSLCCRIPRQTLAS